MPFVLHRLAMMLIAIAATLATPIAGAAQWQMQDSHSTASLRGIHAANDSVAWASGSEGTILRTGDGGLHWQRCATPPGAEKLDFRGVWAWDTENAVVLSSGPGELSRVYKTTDGCAHWTEEAQNHDPQGFWDALVFEDEETGVLIGDPLKGHFETLVMISGPGWVADEKACPARDGEAGFAASNSALFVFGPRRYVIATGGKAGPRVLLSPLLAYNDSNKECLATSVPLAAGNESSGAFSISFRDLKHGVVVGGDYKKPDLAAGTAAWTADGGHRWTAPSKPPHGYRSAVAWYPDANVWVAVGTNGSDISRDDGKTWQVLDDGKWNAVSPPFAVGPGGQIGKLPAESLSVKPR